MGGWDDVKYIDACARTYARGVVVDENGDLTDQSGLIGEGDDVNVFQEIVDGHAVLPEGFAWLDVIQRVHRGSEKVIRDERLREIMAKTKLTQNNLGRVVRAAVELMLGQRFETGTIAGPDKQRNPRRRTFTTELGITHKVPPLSKIVKQAALYRDRPGIGCMEVRDIYGTHGTLEGPEGSKSGGPELAAADITIDGNANFDPKTWAGVSTDQQIEHAVKKGLHDGGVHRNIQINKDVGTPAACYVRDPDRAMKTQLLQMERLFAENLHENRFSEDDLIDPERLNSSGELEVKLRGCWWFDGSTKGNKGEQALCMTTPMPICPAECLTVRLRAAQP
jgi:hypothetical protein